MYCPECGNDAGDANFCPECGADLKGVKGAIASRSGQGQRTTGQQRRKGGAQADPGAAQRQPTGKLSPAVIWGGFGILAIVVVVIVVLASGGFGGGSTANNASAGSATPTPVQADTSGAYGDLVQRANGLYDKGQTAFQAQQFEQGSLYFQAASKVYAAAWAKQASDPSVGTDYATALFYGGNIQPALDQIDLVIKKFPSFQTAYFNKGNYLAHKGRIAQQSGDTKAAKAAFTAAEQAYTKAVAIDPKSEVGKEADQQLQTLQQQ